MSGDQYLHVIKYLYIHLYQSNPNNMDWCITINIISFKPGVWSLPGLYHACAISGWIQVCTCWNMLKNQNRWFGFFWCGFVLKLHTFEGGWFSSGASTSSGCLNLGRVRLHHNQPHNRKGLVGQPSTPSKLSNLLARVPNSQQLVSIFVIILIIKLVIIFIFILTVIMVKANNQNHWSAWPRGAACNRSWCWETSGAEVSFQCYICWYRIFLKLIMTIGRSQK